jgi:SAM-dependent methyltransferase
MSEVDPFAANRKNWNETAAIHERARLAGLLEAVARDDFSTFDEVERSAFDRIGLHGKAVAQPSCNNARELISVKKAGAGRCVGFDISDAFIEQGKRLAGAGNVEVELVRTNVYDIPASYSDSFDLVYITVGTLGWLPDMDRFFATVARLLKMGGDLFVYEMHPALFLYDEEETSPTDPRIGRSYFHDEAVVFEGDPDYFDRTSIVESPAYWYQHPLGVILSAVLSSGLAIRGFEEYPHDISESYAEFEAHAHSLPMSYSLLARKDG